MTVKEESGHHSGSSSSIHTEGRTMKGKKLGAILLGLTLVLFIGMAIGYASNGGNPTVSEEGLYNFPWFNATIGVDAPTYTLDGVDKTDIFAYPQQPASYIVWKEGSIYYAKNGTTGTIDYSGANPVTVAQNAHDALVDGGSLYFRNGVYIFRRDFDVTKNSVTIIGDRNAVIKRCDQASTTLTNDVGLGDLVIQVTDAGGFEVGDGVIVVDDTSSAPYSDRTLSYIQEINGNDITLTSTISYAVTVAQNARVHTKFRLIIVTGDKVIISGFTVDDNEANNPIYIFKEHNYPILVVSENVITENMRVVNVTGIGILYDGSGCKNGIIKNNFVETQGLGEKGVDIGGSASQVLVDGNIVSGFDINIYTCADIHEINIVNNILLDAGSGITIGGTTSDNIQINNNLLKNCIQGVTLYGNVDLFVSVTSNHFKNCSTAMYCNADKLKINDNVFIGNTSHTSYHISLRLCDEVQICNNYMMGIEAAGSKCSIYIDGCTYTSVKDNRMLDSGRYGIYLTDVVTHIDIEDNIINAAWKDIQAVPIDAASEKIYILHNEVRGGGIDGSDPSMVILDNYPYPGYINKNAGNATLLNGNTAVIVNHGCDYTPSAGDIQFHPIETLNNADFCWSDTITATQFTIHVDQDPSADVDFAWSVDSH